MKKLLLPLILAVGCTVPHDYVDPIRPIDVTLAELAVHADATESHYQTYNQVEGVIWQSRRSKDTLANPDLYGVGGDSALFGGFKVAADVFRYNVTKKWEDLLRVKQSLRGIYILTHITGTPGVIARCAFPTYRKEEWEYPARWAHRMQFVSNSPLDVLDPFNGTTFPEMTYYTRATKDQLTGLLLGLGVTLKYLTVDEESLPDEQDLIIKCRKLAAKTALDIYGHLRKYDFKIRDEKGENDTTADSVAGLLNLQLLAVCKVAARMTNPLLAKELQEKFDDQLCCVFPAIGDLLHIFTNYTQYYAWNLRYTRAYTVYIMSDDVVKQEVRDWCSGYLWPYIKGHRNTWFIYINNVIDPSKGKLDEAGLSLRSTSLRPTRGMSPPHAGDERKPSILQVLFTNIDEFTMPPHLRKVTSYFLWQKEPWDTGGGLPLTLSREDPTGLDFILPYWMGRFYGLLK